jgi:hypothetical protein
MRHSRHKLNKRLVHAVHQLLGHFVLEHGVGEAEIAVLHQRLPVCGKVLRVASNGAHSPLQLLFKKQARPRPTELEVSTVRRQQLRLALFEYGHDNVARCWYVESQARGAHVSEKLERLFLHGRGRSQNRGARAATRQTTSTCNGVTRDGEHIVYGVPAAPGGEPGAHRGLGKPREELWVRPHQELHSRAVAAATAVQLAQYEVDQGGMKPVLPPATEVLWDHRRLLRRRESLLHGENFARPTGCALWRRGCSCSRLVCLQLRGILVSSSSVFRDLLLVHLRWHRLE